MAKYIYQRNKVYYFKMRIPTTFVSKLGFNEIHKTLKTSSHPIAKRLAAKLKHKLNKFFNSSNSTLSREGIGKIIADILIQENDQDRKTSIPQKNCAISPKEILQKIISGKTLYAEDIPNNFLSSTDNRFDENGNVYRILLQEFLKAFIDVIRTENQRYPAYPQNSNSNAKKLSQLVAQYEKEHITAGAWAPKTEIEFKSFLKLLVDILGDIDLNTITYDMMLEYRDKLTRLPANRSKIQKYRNKTINELLSLKGIKPMNVSTVNKHLALTSSLFKWGTKRDFMQKNVAEGLIFKTKIKPSEERSPYSKEELLKILHEVKKINRNVHPERYWVPIIALLSGMRQNEICQLYTNDILEVKGIVSFSVNGDGYDKKVKTTFSTRILPVHPILIELGFLQYVENCKTIQLWKNLRHSKKLGYAYLFQKWYQIFNRKRITKDGRKTFHSFRHNVADNLKQQGVQTQMIAEILGHTTDNITVERYGKVYHPEILLETLKKLDFGIDIVKELQ